MLKDNIFLLNLFILFVQKVLILLFIVKNADLRATIKNKQKYGTRGKSVYDEYFYHEVLGNS